MLQGGLFTTVQDAGRWGWQHYGVPVAGAMDLVSHRLANRLVGNDEACATLEATLTGPELRFERDAVVAVAGADLGATLDGAALPMHRAVSCAGGSVLRFGVRRSGARACIAVAGGIDIPPVLGSRATHVLSGLGGAAGRALRAGDRLPIGAVHGTVSSRAVQGLPPVHGGARLRVLPGPQRDGFGPDAFETLQRTRFTITPQSNRMGYRLAGAAVRRGSSPEMISDATFAGAIQVPASGEPILLMADRQTTGGYPQIATVISADLAVAGQLAPGDWVAFEMCSRREAVAALLEQEAMLLAAG